LYTFKTMNAALMKNQYDIQFSDEERIIHAIQHLLEKNRQGMTISDISRALGINRTLVLNILNLMTGRGDISMRSFGRAKVYTLSSKIPVARLLSLSSDLFLIVDNDLYIEDFNDPCAHFFHIRLEEMKGTNIRFSHIPELFTHDIIRALEDAASGTKRIFEDYVRSKEGRNFFRVSCIPVQETDFSTKVALVLHDLTLHKKYEEHLEEQLRIRTRELSSSLRRYEILADLAPVGIFETDAKGNVIYVNKKWSEITGYTLDEVRGRRWVKTIHPAEREWIKKLWYEHVAENIPWNHSYRYMKKTGEEVHAMATAVPLRNQDDIVTGYLGTVVDITDRVAAEQVIQDLNIYLSTILEDANDGIATIDAQGRFTSCNAAGCRILRTDKNALIGRDVRILYASDDIFEQTKKKIHRELTGTGHFRGEIQIIDGDGAERIIDASMSYLKEHGIITGIILLFRDVTENTREKLEAIRQEKQLKTILDGLIDAVFVIDRNGTVLYANARACRYLCDSDTLDRNDLTLSDVLPTDQAHSLLSYHQQVIDSQVPASKIMNLTIRGREYHVLNRVVPVLFGENNVDAVISLLSESDSGLCG